MLRTDFQELARIRLREARQLLKTENYSGAYYLTGMAIECAIKARISRYTQRHEFPNKKRVNDCHTHDLATLVRLAGLEASLQLKCNSDSSFDANWTIIKDWDNESRYDGTISDTDAHAIYSAAVSRRYGVMRWLRRNW